MAAKDTADLQNSALQALLRMRTQQSFIAFKDLIIQEPPVVTSDNSSNTDYSYDVGRLAKAFSKTKSSYSGNWYSLYDTLSIAKIIFPDMLQLMNLDDYKGTVMELLTTLVDSGYVDAKMYESFYTKFYAEAKQELKKERARENQKSIAKAEIQP